MRLHDFIDLLPARSAMLPGPRFLFSTYKMQRGHRYLLRLVYHLRVDGWINEAAIEPAPVMRWSNEVRDEQGSLARLREAFSFSVRSKNVIEVEALESSPLWRW